MKSLPVVDVADLMAARPAKHSIPLNRPYAFVAEQERAANGRVEWVSTLFLSNRECPFRCLMCDLWKNTIDEPTPPKAVVQQIATALAELPVAKHIKLYNSGNFFDTKAIPASDLPAIAAQVTGYDTVIVENHPLLCGDSCLAFRQQVGGEFEVAMGLETAHAPSLQWLNKGMTLDDFCRAADQLRAHDIHVRSFVLLNTPGMSPAESEEWAVRSVEFALNSGARCVSIVPTRAGNGLMDQLERDGLFQPPKLANAERAFASALAVADSTRQRVFLDLWDLAGISSCSRCLDAREQRLNEMNWTQQTQPPAVCHVCGGSQ